MRPKISFLFIWALGFILLALIPTLVATAQSDDNAFAMPYMTYGIDGGCHADGWGTWCAVDVYSIPDGDILLSPINGRVINTGPDDGLGEGNTFLILENSRWKVYMLHGDYNVSIGQQVSLGQVIGKEACHGRCYDAHTHLSVYDKKIGAWVDPRTIVNTKQARAEEQSDTINPGGDGQESGGGKVEVQPETQQVSARFNLSQPAQQPPQPPSTASIFNAIMVDQKTNSQAWVIIVGVVMSGILLANHKSFGFFLACCLLIWSILLVKPAYHAQHQQEQAYQNYVKYVKVVWQVDVEAEKPTSIQQPPQQLPGPGYSNKIAPLFTPEVQYWGDKIVKWANQWGLDPNLVATVMQIESCGDPKAESNAGAMGLFQVMPFHFTSGENSHDPNTNAKRGLAYLSKGLELANGDAGLALAGYNGGHGRIGQPQSIWPSETQRYYYWGTGIYQDAQKNKSGSKRLNEWLGAGGASLCRQAANRLGLP